MQRRLICLLLLLFGVWKKSGRSNGNGGNNCVEVAMNVPGFIGVRDSKDRTGPALIFNRETWGNFVEGVRGGEFDL